MYKKNIFLNFPSQFAEALSYEEQIRLLSLCINEIVNNFDNVLDGAITEWIEKNYNQLFFNAAYNEDTETIIFAKGGEK